MTTEEMATEEKLAEIRAEVEQLSSYLPCCVCQCNKVTDRVPWLLELVRQGHWSQAIKLRGEVWALRERVRELEGDTECASCGDPNQVRRGG